MKCFLKIELNQDGQINMSYVSPKVRKPEKMLEWYYEQIGCDLIEHAVRKINGEYYDLIFDEEFLLKKLPKGPTMYMLNGQEMLFGTILVCRYVPNSYEFVPFDSCNRGLFEIRSFQEVKAYLINPETKEYTETIIYEY